MDSPALNTQTLIDTVAGRAGSTDPLVLLETAVTVATLAGSAADTMVDHYVRAAREAGLSWTDIGARLGVSKQAARQRYAPRLETGAGPAPLAPRLAACVQAAQEAADAEGSVPGTQHLLLGLLQVGLAANVLDRLGVTREKVVESAARLLPPAGSTGTVGDGEAHDAVMGARRFAANRGQSLTRTQHLLFILATDPGSSARRILDDLGVDPARVKKELDDYIPPPPSSGRRARKIAERIKGSVIRSCSFCGCADPHRAMVNGPGVQICGECVVLAGEIIASRSEQAEQDRRTEGEQGPGRRLLG